MSPVPKGSPAATFIEAGEAISADKTWFEEKGGNKWRFHMGLDVPEAVGKKMRTSKIAGTKDVEAMVSAILGNGSLANDVAYDVANAPESEKKSWNPKGGHKAMVLGYCGYALGDSAVEGTQRLLEEVEDDILDGIGLSKPEAFEAVQEAFKKIPNRQTRI